MKIFARRDRVVEQLMGAAARETSRSEPQHTDGPERTAEAKHSQRQRRVSRSERAAVDRDIVTLLTAVASSVRAGFDPVAAVTEAREFFPHESPVRRELQLFYEGLARGDDEEVAIRGLFARIPSPEVELFKGCLLLARKHGSSLAEPLHRIARVVRQRQSFRRKTRAALAMHRMSAVGIAICAALIGVIQAAMNPAGIAVACAQPVGLALLGAGSLLIVTGIAWMMSLGRETRA